MVYVPGIAWVVVTGRIIWKLNSKHDYFIKGGLVLIGEFGSIFFYFDWRCGKHKKVGLTGLTVEFASHYRTSRPSSLMWLAEQEVWRTPLRKRDVNRFFVVRVFPVCCWAEKRWNAVEEFPTEILFKMRRLIRNKTIYFPFQCLNMLYILNRRRCFNSVRALFAKTHKHAKDESRVSFSSFMFTVDPVGVHYYHKEVL